ncbi:GNAT family N-acetyltransferase [Trinickia sp. EG282A]|uniref:GNAT family N-acetyltransferase n=1 Tax=Trinickia sp. EG282A TaxID=3237013 RepID=UPI0034D27A18
MRARFFQADDALRWDDFCARCHGATFLHSYRFLSYHGDRFADRSIIIEDGEDWLGVIPAARHPFDEDVVVSHPGVTYGGMLHDGRLRGVQMIAALDAAAGLWRSAGFKQLRYKCVPHIYQAAPAQDDLYALFRVGAVRYRCDLSSCIDLRHRLPVSGRRLRAQKKASRAGILVTRGNERLPEFWAVLEENLLRKHSAKPVHTLDEIEMLAERFPDRIRLMAATLNGNVEAGIVLFLSETVAHAQYIASSEPGYEVNALDAVFEESIEQSRMAGKRFFDFGISTEDDGRVLNEGLNQFKNEFGAGGVVYEFYQWDLRGNDNGAE